MRWACVHACVGMVCVRLEGRRNTASPAKFLCRDINADDNADDKRTIVETYSVHVNRVLLSLKAYRTACINMVCLVMVILVREERE